MNILVLSDVIAYSGVGQYMMQLGEEFSNRNNVVVLASPRVQRKDLPTNILVEQLPNPRNIAKYL